jgi:magnesium transporter
MQNTRDLELEKKFLKDTSLIEYTVDTFVKTEIKSIQEIIISNESPQIQWLNTYTFNYSPFIKEVVHLNKLDEFLLNLTTDDDHRNKVIELEKCFFLTVKVLHYNNVSFYTEQMVFIVSPTFVWSIQERQGDYFGHIRTRLKENKGVVRKKKADYLLYLILEAIIDNYVKAYEKLTKANAKLNDLAAVKPEPDFLIEVENNKKNLFIIKKAVSSLREAISQLEKLDIEDFKTHYFNELKEQASFLMDDIDFNLQQVESSINLIFSFQSHRLNEVMKTLTILSAIFIPLTFLAGIYGMNFTNIPELSFKYGYFLLLGLMVLITVLIVFYFKRKGWFD